MTDEKVTDIESMRKKVEQAELQVLKDCQAAVSQVLAKFGCRQEVNVEVRGIGGRMVLIGSIVYRRAN